MTDVPVDPPKWRRDFPYTSGGEDDVTRREFTRYLVLGIRSVRGRYRRGRGVVVAATDQPRQAPAHRQSSTTSR